MTFVNLTPHEIKLRQEDGTMLVLPPCKNPARVKFADNVQGLHQGIPVKGKPIPVGLEFLPEPDEKEFKLFIVSRMVKDAVPDRWDVVVPADQVKDNKGNILYTPAVAL
jgi:hypothetical protein